MPSVRLFDRRRCHGIAILAILVIVGCGSTPKAVEPTLRRQALEAEADGGRRYARADYAGALRSFAAAGRLQQSIDDQVAAARNALHQARAELALGQNQEALNRASRIAPAELAYDALLVQVQANLGLGRIAAAKLNLAAAATACAADCPGRPSRHLLQARAALADGRAHDALGYAETALKLLPGTDELNETGNAWRLVAAARLAAGDAAGALPAARAALEIDRRLALPEKIARDWLLIGDALRRNRPAHARPGEISATPAGVTDGADSPAAAYQHALDVANAAGLVSIAAIANKALAEVTVR